MLAVPGFQAERCVRYRYRYSACSRCADACAHEAIELADDGVRVRADSCKGCALCVAACPTEALKSREVSFTALEARCDDTVQMSIACAPSGCDADVVVPCLGALDALTLAAFARRGIALRLLGSTHCAGCEHAAKGPQMIALHQEAYRLLSVQAAQLEQTWAEHEWQDEEAAKRADTPDGARRALFRRLLSHGSDVLSGKLEHPPVPLKAIRAAAPFLPQRKVLLNGLFGDVAEEKIKVARHPALPAEDWQVNKGCNHCEACVRVCPTGAIQLLENTGAWRLAFLNDRCVACDVCAEACQPGVLQAVSGAEVVVNKQKGRLLAAVAKQRCTRCDRVFVNEGGRDICPICSSDDEDFAELFG